MWEAMDTDTAIPRAHRHLKGYVATGLTRTTLEAIVADCIQQSASYRNNLRNYMELLEQLAVRRHAAEKALQSGVDGAERKQYEINVPALRLMFPDGNVQVFAELDAALSSPRPLRWVRVEFTEPAPTFSDGVLTVKVKRPIMGAVSFTSDPNCGLAYTGVRCYWTQDAPYCGRGTAIAPTPHLNRDDSHACVVEETRRIFQQYANANDWMGVCMLLREYLNTYDAHNGPYISLDEWAVQLVEAKVDLEVTSTDDNALASEILAGERTRRRCAECGDRIMGAEYTTIQGRDYHMDCAPETTDCDGCGDEIVLDDAYTFHGRDRYYCENCFNYHAATCDNCGEDRHEDDLAEVEGHGRLCDRCSHLCADCDEYFASADMTLIDGRWLCQGCIDDRADAEDDEDDDVDESYTAANSDDGGEGDPTP